MREPAGAAVWLVATTANVAAAAFNSRIDADPIAIAWMRMVVATLALALLARGLRRVGWNRTLVLMGFAIAGMNAAFYVALPRIGLGLTVALGLVGPIALAAVLGRTRRDAVAVVLAAVGVLAMARPVGGGRRPAAASRSASAAASAGSPTSWPAAGPRRRAAGAGGRRRASRCRRWC